MAGEVVLIDPFTGNSYKAGGASGAQPSASSQSVTPASTGSAFAVLGNVSSGTADSGGAVKVGGKAASAIPSSTTVGNRVDFLTDTFGKQVIALGVSLGGGDALSNNITSPAPLNSASSSGLLSANMYYNGATWDRTRGDVTGGWAHNPPSTASSALSGTIATSGGTAAITMTNATRTEIINPSTGVLWASWGTPAVNGAGSFPINAGGAYNIPDRAAGTLTLLSTAATQPYTVNRFS